ncbi:MAG: hypothetical protein VW644_06015, partial [Alphaproteobacteria bacterium]|jgi:hypothetical protein
MTTPPDNAGHAHNDAMAISRRRALARLGIAAGIAYSAPTIVRLDRRASAKVLPSPCPPPGGGGKRPPG